MKTGRPLRLGVLAALGLAVAACAAPVSATRVDPTIVQRDLARSAVSTGQPSWPTRNVLFERGLFEAYTERPEAALAELHRTMVAWNGDPDLLFALAELSLLHGKAAAKREYHLAAAVYAWALLFPEGTGQVPGRFDPRLRIAADLYNWSLAEGFASEDGSEVVPRSATFELPFGPLAVTFDPASLRAGERELHHLVPAAALPGRWGVCLRRRRGPCHAGTRRPYCGSRDGAGRPLVGHVHPGLLRSLSLAWGGISL